MNNSTKQHFFLFTIIASFIGLLATPVPPEPPIDTGHTPILQLPSGDTAHERQLTVEERQQVMSRFIAEQWRYTPTSANQQLREFQAIDGTIAYANSDGQLSLMNAQGGAQRVLNTNLQHVDWPAWSHDNTTIATIADGADTSAGRCLYTVDVANGAARQLLCGFSSIYMSTWSPDDQRLALLGKHSETGWFQSWVVDTKGSSAIQIAKNTPQTHSPMWLSTTSIVIPGATTSNQDAWQLYRVNLLQPNRLFPLTPVFTCSGCNCGAGQWVGEPHLAPDGRTIAFLGAYTKGKLTCSSYYAIYTVKADGLSNPQYIGDVTSEAVASSLEWSPDNVHISSYGKVGSVLRLHIADTNGPTVQRLNSASIIVDTKQRMSWAPDGAQLAVMDQPASEKSIASVNPSTDVLTRLDAGTSPDWTTAPAYVPPPVDTPLIVIPGIMGSMLRRATPRSEELWPGLFRNKMDLLLPSQLDVVATDAIRKIQVEIPAPEVYRGYIRVEQVFYQDLLSSLVLSGYHENANDLMTPQERCESSTEDTTLYIFAYDWRKDIAMKDGAADQLQELVQCIEQKHPGKKVDILAHSMGSLVARRYILNTVGDQLDNPQHNVRKLITIGAPWLGAPKMLAILNTGDAFDDWLTSVAMRLSTEEIVRLTKTFAGAHQLLASKAYMDLGGRPVAVDDGESIYFINEYEDYISLLNKDNSTFLPGKTNDTFHSFPGQDDWSKEAKTGIEYYHIYGITEADTTPLTFLDRQEPDCNRVSECSAALATHLKKGKGDGTVPLLSAMRISDTLNLNAQQDTVTLWPVQERQGSRADGVAEHTKMVSNPRVQGCVLFALLGGKMPCSLEKYEQPSSAQSSTQAETASQPAYYLYTRGADRVTVENPLGETTDTISGTISYPAYDITTHRLGEKANEAIMPADQTYTATLKVGAEPMYIEILTGTGASTTQAIRYRDLVLPAGITAQLILSPQGITDLRYDADNDGVFESTVTPTVSINGAAANDQDPPTIVINHTGTLDKLTVTFTAEDRGSGLASVHYSLDGYHFVPYTGPFEVNGIQSPIIYAFADDKVANRSSLLTHQVGWNNILPVITR